MDDEQMTVERAAELLQIEERGEELLALVEANPNVAKAMWDVAQGVRPEQAAARYDLTWVD